MNENESILYIKVKLGKRSICVKYAIRFLSVAAFFLMIEQTSFFITRHAAKNMLEEKEQKEILIRLPPKSESEVRVNAQMDIFLEEYSVDTGQLLFVEPYWDIRLAGMNEEELRLFYQIRLTWKRKMIYEAVLGVSLLRWTGVHLGLGNM